MIHGDIVTITSEGLLVHEKALQPLGIYDQSICWAVWAAARNEAETTKREPNLIVSPIHPSSWPFLIRLEIALSDKKGALAWLCEQLQKMKLSILFLEGTTTGFNHAFCNVIAESAGDDLVGLRRKKEDFDRDNPHVRISNKAFNKAQEIANEIAAVMFDHVREIERTFEGLLESDETRFLHRWIRDMDRGHFLYKEEDLGREMQKIRPEQTAEEHIAYVKKFFPQTVEISYMQRLAYFSMFGGGVDVPFSFRYQADSALLKLESNDIFASEGIRIYHNEEPFELGRLPRPAISTFNSREKYLRLKPVTTNMVKHNLTRISIEYGVEQVEPMKRDPTASVGLLKLICDELKVADVRLLHNSNKWTRYKYARESGLMSFIADIPKEKYVELKEAISSINSHKPIDLKSVKIRTVSVYEYPQRRLFVSLHFGHPRQTDIKRIIHAVALECGFEETIVETYVAPATRTILEQIGTCQAFLQLLLLREDDNEKNISFSWLDFEYGVASGKNMPTIRLVDTVRISYDWWKNRITTNPDQRVRDFRSDTSEEALTEVLRGAVQELTQELLRRQQETG